MTPLAQCLPIVSGPEELLVTTVWNDVVDHSGLHVPALSLALLAQWVCLKELSACLPPGVVIAAARSGPYLFWVHQLVTITVPLP